MVHVSSSSQGQFFNTDARIGMGSTGDDVRLVQYLLARAPDAAPFVPGFMSGSPRITVGDVDGVWGTQTDAAEKWLEQNCVGLEQLIADGFIDTVAPGGIGLGETAAGQLFQYKLDALMFFYAVAMCQGLNMHDQTMYGVVMDMPADPQCPGDLAYALQAALNSAPTADGDAGDSGGSDGG
jgi:hypothetical protein